ncbi:MAG: ABC-2 family transporter protein [Bdellovibrionales bacterium]|nr:ABC-2 family transporter protein [Bdellovibrionales bacterium]
MIRSLRAYGAFFVLAARQELFHRGALIGRFAFYGVILLVFSRIWLVVSASGQLPEGEATDLLWYLVVTEWIVLSIPMTHMEIEQEVKTGNVAYALTRPVSFVWIKTWEGLGHLWLRMAVLAGAGLFFGLLLTGAWPSRPMGLLLVVPVGLLAGTVSLLFHNCIGVGSFWLTDASPLYWIWQKMNFILGGLILPLSLYPEWLQQVAHLTPFASLLYGPGQVALKADLTLAAHVTIKLLGWGLVAAFLLEALYRRGCAKLNVNGG